MFEQTPTSTPTQDEESATSTLQPSLTPAAEERYKELGLPPTPTTPLNLPLTFLKSFSPLWFTIALDTGILRSPLHDPLCLHFIPVCRFFVLLCGEIVVVLGEYVGEGERDAEEIAFLGAPAIAFLTIVGQVALTCSEAWGHGWTVLAYVLWWVGTVWIVTICTTLYISAAKLHLVNDKTLPSIIFLPLVGVMTAATIGGTIASQAYHISARLAVPMIIVSYMLIGYGTLVALMVYALYLLKLLERGWPAPEKVPGLILLVGPMGQSSTALQQLGRASSTLGEFAAYNKGTFLTGPSALGFDSACMLLALLFLGMGCFWLCVAIFGILEVAFQRKLTLSLLWWSTIFPLGTVATSLISLSIELDSPTFRVLATGLMIIMFILYFVNWFYTLPMTLRAAFHEHGFQKRLPTP